MIDQRKNYAKRKLDFEIGHLVKSPCKGCVTRYQFPGCITTCVILDRVQTRLALAISCTRNYSPLEAFNLQLERRKEK